MSGQADRWIRRTTIGCVGLLALIAGTVSYLHMHLLVELHGQLVAGSAASRAANVAVAEPRMTGRVIAAWPSFSLIAAYELLMRQVRHAAEAGTSRRRSSASSVRTASAAAASHSAATRRSGKPVALQLGETGRDVRQDAWQWAQDNRAEDGALPPDSESARQS